MLSEKFGARLGLLFARNADVPDAGGEEDHAAAGAEPDEKGHVQIKPRADSATGRKPAAEKRVEGAGPCVLQAFLENQFHRFVRARERGGALFRANCPLGVRKFGAIGADGTSAITTDGNGLGIMGGAFHRVESGVAVRDLQTQMKRCNRFKMLYCLHLV